MYMYVCIYHPAFWLCSLFYTKHHLPINAVCPVKVQIPNTKLPNSYE